MRSAAMQETTGRRSSREVVIVTALSTAFAMALGSMVGLQTGNAWRATAASQPSADAAKAIYAKPMRLAPIGPIITNLAGSSTRGIRLEGAIVLDGQMSESESKILAAKVSEDILAYLRTVTVANIEGATGLQYLREDLNERIRIRSQGKATELIIKSLIVE